MDWNDIRAHIQLPTPYDNTDDEDDETYSPRKKYSIADKRGGVRSRKPRKVNNKKSRVLKGRSKQREYVPPKDHLFKLPPEIRNQIYEYVLHDEISVYACYDCVPRRIESGDDAQPSLLWTCTQVRREAVPMFLAMTNFEIIVDIRDLRNLAEWLQITIDRYSNGKHYTKVFGWLDFHITNVEWQYLGHLVDLAQMAMLFPDYVLADSIDTGPSNVFERMLHTIVRDAVNLGQQAYDEDWHPDELGIVVEEMLENKLDTALARQRSLSSRKIQRLETGFPGDWYGTDQAAVDDFEGPKYTCSRPRESSDRKLRSRRSDSAKHESRLPHPAQARRSKVIKKRPQKSCKRPKKTLGMAEDEDEDE